MLAVSFREERVKGIEPSCTAWKAVVLPLNYTRKYPSMGFKSVEGVGFEPTKAKPSDLQSDPFDRSGNPPKSNSQPLVNSQIRLLLSQNGQSCRLPDTYKLFANAKNTLTSKQIAK